MFLEDLMSAHFFPNKDKILENIYIQFFENHFIVMTLKNVKSEVDFQPFCTLSLMLNLN
jgi:hypothetical protein